MEPLVLISTHLRLRNFRASDLDAVLAYRTHPDVCRYIGDPLSREQVAAYIERFKGGWAQQPDQLLRLAVELRDEGAIIGETIIRCLGAEERQAEIGLALEPRHQRRSLGLEILLGLMRYCFEDLGLHRVIAITDVQNEAALRLTDRIGFKREGILRKNAFRYGEWRDEYLVALLDEEWPEVRRRFAHLLAPAR